MPTPVSVIRARHKGQTMFLLKLKSFYSVGTTTLFVVQDLKIINKYKAFRTVNPSDIKLNEAAELWQLVTR